VLILPVLAAILLFRLFRRSGAPGEAFLRAAVSVGVLVIGLTELLSLLRGLSPLGIATGWVAVIVLVGGALWLSPRAGASRPAAS
jgi:hypothetical protein